MGGRRLQTYTHTNTEANHYNQCSVVPSLEVQGKGLGGTNGVRCTIRVEIQEFIDTQDKHNAVVQDSSWDVYTMGWTSTINKACMHAHSFH